MYHVHTHARTHTHTHTKHTPAPSTHIPASSPLHQHTSKNSLITGRQTVTVNTALSLSIIRGTNRSTDVLLGHKLLFPQHYPNTYSRFINPRSLLINTHARFQVKDFDDGTSDDSRKYRMESFYYCSWYQSRHGHASSKDTRASSTLPRRTLSFHQHTTPSYQHTCLSQPGTVRGRDVRRLP